MAIVLSDLLDPRHIDLVLRARSSENAVRHLVGLLAANEQVAQPENFLKQVLDRERANPNLVEHGVVFPHARTDLAEKIILAVGRSRAGIPFGRDGARARLIFLIGVPQRLISDYLVCVGALARIAKNDDIRGRLLRAKTPEDFIETLRANTTTL